MALIWNIFFFHFIKTFHSISSTFKTWCINLTKLYIILGVLCMLHLPFATSLSYFSCWNLSIDNTATSPFRRSCFRSEKQSLITRVICEKLKVLLNKRMTQDLVFNSLKSCRWNFSFPVSLSWVVQAVTQLTDKYLGCFTPV